MRGHENIVTCLGFESHFLLSGSLDTTVRVWDLKSLTVQHTLISHTKKITSVIGSNGKVVSASDDRTIKIWLIKDGSLLFTINNLIGSIINLIGFGKYLISCATNGKLVY